MKKCYFCGNNLDKNNQTEEHIIQNSFGGRLKSKNILCRKCNSILGSKIDAKLYNNLNFFDILMGIDKERKTKGGHITAFIDDDKIKLFSGLKYESAPKICEKTNGSVKNIYGHIITSAGNKEVQDRFIENFFNKARKNGFNGSIDDLKKSMVKAEFSDKWINVNKCFKEDEIVLGYLKIVIGFCSYHDKLDLIDEKMLNAFRNAVNNIDNSYDENVKFILDNTYFIEQKYFCDGRLCNRLALIGDKEKHKLYAVVGIYDFLHFAIVLSDNYLHESFEEKYIYDVMNKKYLDCNMPSCSNMLEGEKKYDSLRKGLQNNIEYILSFCSSVSDIHLLSHLVLMFVNHIIKNYCDKMNPESFREKFVNDFLLLREKEKQIRCLLDDDFEKLANLSYNFYVSKFNNFTSLIKNSLKDCKEQNKFVLKLPADINLSEEDIVRLFIKDQIKDSWIELLAKN